MLTINVCDLYAEQLTSSSPQRIFCSSCWGSKNFFQCILFNPLIWNILCQMEHLPPKDGKHWRQENIFAVKNTCAYVGGLLFLVFFRDAVTHVVSRSSWDSFYMRRPEYQSLRFHLSLEFPRKKYIETIRVNLRVRKKNTWNFSVRSCCFITKLHQKCWHQELPVAIILLYKNHVT